MSTLQRQRRRRPELNLVPLIDVLVMLIFFAFVTMQFRAATALKITLPKIDTAGKSNFKGSVTITIDKDGGLTLNGKPITDDQLDPLLRQLHARDPKTAVLLKSDQTTPLGKVTFVWGACLKNDLPNIHLESR
jgi:biopolymer transport protein ExbD